MTYLVVTKTHAIDLEKVDVFTFSGEGEDRKITLLFSGDNVAFVTKDQRMITEIDHYIQTNKKNW